MNARRRLRERLAGGPLLADGAMGTLLFSRGVPQRACLDELPTTRPDLVGAIHREYLEAGAELIETVTFGANRHRLAAFGLAAAAGRFNRRAAQVARDARDVAGREALVAGSVGPLGAPTRELLHLADGRRPERHDPRCLSRGRPTADVFHRRRRHRPRHPGRPDDGGGLRAAVRPDRAVTRAARGTLAG